jgi:hypothetical protein
MAPHVDLSKAVEPEDAQWCADAGVDTSVTSVSSTHTFLLYLRTCAAGGETALLEDVKSPAGAVGACTAPALANVKPVRGRLLVFPHNCPHAGRPVIDAPKLVLRGELW